jgi:hypothetical protein
MWLRRDKVCRHVFGDAQDVCFVNIAKTENVEARGTADALLEIMTWRTQQVYRLKEVVALITALFSQLLHSSDVASLHRYQAES